MLNSLERSSFFFCIVYTSDLIKFCFKINFKKEASVFREDVFISRNPLLVVSLSKKYIPFCIAMMGESCLTGPSRSRAVLVSNMSLPEIESSICHPTTLYRIR